MNYELAKRLKDAGWPQEIGGRIYPCDCEIIQYEGYSTCTHRPECASKWCSEPNLTQLIEACGVYFIYLRKVSNAFHAHGARNGNYFNCGLCPTPEEVVANLWLSINKVK